MIFPRVMPNCQCNLFRMRRYVSRGISRRRKCPGCKDLFVGNYDIQQLHLYRKRMLNI